MIITKQVLEKMLKPNPAIEEIVQVIAKLMASSDPDDRNLVVALMACIRSHNDGSIGVTKGIILSYEMTRLRGLCQLPVTNQ